MIDIVPELLEKIRGDFFKEVSQNKSIIRIDSLIQNGSATYSDLNEYSALVGKSLGDSLQRHITVDVLPDGRMYFNIADRTLQTTLRDNYVIVSNATVDVQTVLNQNANLGLKAVKPELNESRIIGLVDKISNEVDFEEVQWLLGDPVINFSQAIVEDSIKANAEFHYDVGLKPKIIRIAEAGACDWCKSIEGTFDYPNVPEDVYRRHANCRCTTDYHPIEGRKTNVWTKR